jgi:hypothetical protein
MLWLKTLIVGAFLNLSPVTTQAQVVKQGTKTQITNEFNKTPPPDTLHLPSNGTTLSDFVKFFQKQEKEIWTIIKHAHKTLLPLQYPSSPMSQILMVLRIASQEVIEGKIDIEQYAKILDDLWAKQWVHNKVIDGKYFDQLYRNLFLYTGILFKRDNKQAIFEQMVLVRLTNKSGITSFLGITSNETSGIFGISSATKNIPIVYININLNALSEHNESFQNVFETPINEQDHIICTMLQELRHRYFHDDNDLHSDRVSSMYSENASQAMFFIRFYDHIITKTTSTRFHHPDYKVIFDYIQSLLDKHNISIPSGMDLNALQKRMIDNKDYIVKMRKKWHKDAQTFTKEYEKKLELDSK